CTHAVRGARSRRDWLSESYRTSQRLTLTILFNDHERLAEFDRLAVLDEYLRHRTCARRWDLVHRFHRFDDQQRLSGRYLGADIDERLGAGLRRPIGGTDHRR